MTKSESRRSTWTIGCVASVLLLSGVVSGCGTYARTLDASQIEQKYGISGAYAGSIATPGGPMQGTIVPITLADGSTARLIIPRRQASDVSSVYLVDNDGLHAIQLKDRASRQDLIRAPSIEQRRPEAPVPAKRSWEKEALIIGGGAGAGTAIGALAGGKKGAGVGAAAGGVGGLIYDLLTRNKS